MLRKNIENTDYGGMKKTLPKAFLVGLLRDMRLLRVSDERVGKRARRGEVPGLLHLGVGEEAVAVGACAALRPEDKITSTHRAHGHFLAKGGSPKALMAELYGKEAGCCRGKGGSMHLVDMNIGFLGANGVVGAGLPLAVGAALGARIKGEDWVVVCFFGDGANNEGAFHEDVTNTILKDLSDLIKPRYMCVIGYWKVRGGIITTVTTKFIKNGWKDSNRLISNV